MKFAKYFIIYIDVLILSFYLATADVLRISKKL